MRTWLLRGAALAVLHAVAETVRTDFGVRHPTSRTLFEAILLGALVGVAAVWAAVDTWRDVPERGRVWLVAALVAGWGGAVLGVVGRAVFVDQTGVADLGAALTGGAAFTALLVVVPAGAGMVAGRWVGRPRRTDDREAEAESAPVPTEEARGSRARAGGRPTPGRSRPVPPKS